MLPLKDVFALANGSTRCDTGAKESSARMMRSHFEQLRRQKAYLEKRDLSIRMIAEETGLSQGALLRVKNLKMERVYLSTLETLCRYFEVKSLSELIEFEPDALEGGGNGP